MFAPALVGVMPLSVAGFETCRSQLSSPGGSAVEGRPIPLLVAKSEEVRWRRSVTNRDIRGTQHADFLHCALRLVSPPGPIGRPSQLSLASRRSTRTAGMRGPGVSVCGYRPKGSARTHAWQRHGSAGLESRAGRARV